MEKRIPDFIDEQNCIIVESKNVTKLSYTQQIRDYVTKAQEMGTQLKIYVRQDTTFSAPLMEAIKNNLITIERFSW